MKSQKKKNKKKLNILIVYNKGIASSLGIELAMLFCHAGFSVKNIFLEEAGEYISDKLLKEITGHSPWTKLFKPDWVKIDIDYTLCVVIEPSKEFQDKLIKENCDDIYLTYIQEHCKMVKILQRKEIIEQTFVKDINKQVISLPDNPLLYKTLFEKLLSETATLAASKVLDRNITYSFKGDFSKIDYKQKIEEAFAHAGIEEKQYIDDNETNLDINTEKPLIIITKDDKKIEIILENDDLAIKPTENRIFISRHKNGLILIDNIEIRLLPDFSCQSSFSRLVNYLKVCLTRNNL